MRGRLDALSRSGSPAQDRPWGGHHPHTVLTASGAAEHGGQLRSQRDAFRKGASATALLSSGLRFACTISERVQRLANGAEVHNPRQLELGPAIQAPSGIARIEFTYRLGGA